MSANVGLCTRLNSEGVRQRSEADWILTRAISPAGSNVLKLPIVFQIMPVKRRLALNLKYCSSLLKATVSNWSGMMSSQSPAVTIKKAFRVLFPIAADEEDQKKKKKRTTDLITFFLSIPN